MDNMSKTKKIVLLLATLAPFFGFVLFYVGFFAFGIYMSTRQPSWEPSPFFMIPFMGIPLLMGLWAMGLLVIYIIHLFKTDRIRKDTKALWAVVLFLGWFFAMLVYWYLNIWREPVEAGQ